MAWWASGFDANKYSMENLDMRKHALISRRPLTPAIAALALVVAGCNGSDSTTMTPTTPTTQFRVIHASSDAPNIDVLLNGMTELTNIPYKSDSLFLTVPAGTTTLNVDPSAPRTASSMPSSRWFESAHSRSRSAWRVGSAPAGEQLQALLVDDPR